MAQRLGGARMLVGTKLRAVQLLFDHAARQGAAVTAGVLSPLVEDFVRYAQPRPGDCALDAGTGTGAVARLLAPQVHRVVGVDVSRLALGAARSVAAGSHASWVQGDLHELPFADGSFSLITAHFGLNMTDPWRCLRSLRRVLAAQGRIVVQEWGPVTAAYAVVEAVLAEHALDAPDAGLATLRERFAGLDDAWTQRLQDTDDYREWFFEVGFTVTDTRETAPVSLRFASVEDFSAFMLAETVRAEEVAALASDARAVFRRELHTQLARFAEPDGTFIWEPVVLRLTAGG